MSMASGARIAAFDNTGLIGAAGRRVGMLFTLLLVAAPASTQRYSAVQQGDTVTLTDRTTDTVVTVVPSVGNIATELRVKGHNVLPCGIRMRRWPRESRLISIRPRTF